MEKKDNRVWVYILITFSLSWAYEIGVILPRVTADPSDQIIQLLVTGCMFFPALGMLLTRLLTREGFRDMMLRPRFRGSVGKYLLAYFGPGLLTVAGAAVYYLAFPAKLDWSAPYFRQTMEAAGMPYEAQAVPMSMLLAIQAVQAFLLGGIINLVPSLGEEWGWRGYMMPRLLKKMKPVPALLLGGVIWGLWHAPLTIMGHNYGLGYPGYPWMGIAAMCVFCVALGTLLTWLTVKTGSVIPAAIAHGAVNGIAALGSLVSADGGVNQIFVHDRESRNIEQCSIRSGRYRQLPCLPCRQQRE